MAVIVPYEDLSQVTLINLVTEFIGREGTDYGFHEVDMEIKVNQVLVQLKSGEVVITYSEADESVNLLPAKEARGFLGGNVK